VVVVQLPLLLGQTRASVVVISVLLAYRVLPEWSSEALIST
jgi:hypothetical protein